ncbi:MAG: hypothetical protein QW403_03425 [Candidatus Aenigmatarchaeota archaeon]
MVESPIVIIIEIFLGLIAASIQMIIFLFGKLGELFVSLAYLAVINPIGFIISVFIGAICLYFILKLIFRESKFLLLAFGIFILFLVSLLIIAILIA